MDCNNSSGINQFYRLLSGNVVLRVVAQRKKGGIVMELLIFYYVFSVLFMIGYADFGELDSVGITVLAILALLIFAPILFPMNLGCAIHEIRN